MRGAGTGAVHVRVRFYPHVRVGIFFVGRAQNIRYTKQFIVVVSLKKLRHVFFPEWRFYIEGDPIKRRL